MTCVTSTLNAFSPEPIGRNLNPYPPAAFGNTINCFPNCGKKSWPTWNATNKRELFLEHREVPVTKSISIARIGNGRR